MEKGLFIALEGGEGSGKSTLMANMKELFELEGHKVVTFREPGGTAFAENIRELFLKNTSGLSGESVALLMNAARVDNINQLVTPALNEGKIVIADRFSASSLVYQGLRKNEYEAVERVTKHIPMISVFVDTPPEVGIQRIIDNNREVNRFDLLPIEFHQKVYDGYQQLEQLKPEIYWDVVLDGLLSTEELKEDLAKTLIPMLSKEVHEGRNTEEIKQLVRGQESLVLT